MLCRHLFTGLALTAAILATGCGCFRKSNSCCAPPPCCTSSAAPCCPTPPAPCCGGAPAGAPVQAFASPAPGCNGGAH